MPKRDLPPISPGVTALGGLTVLMFALASACGGGGPSATACRTGTPTDALTPSPAASLTMKVGSYEGTGSPQCVRDVGFLPVLVIIKGDTGGEPAVWRSSSMEGDATTDLITARPSFEDGITSLDPEAFSLGKHPAVNAEGVAYYYVAFADSPDIRVGSYIGDRTDGRRISGLGFQPELVFLRIEEARSATWRSAAHPEGLSSDFQRTGELNNFITGFGADWFQVSSDAIVNGDGDIYHYVAFGEVPGRLKSGSYSGDGSENRNITGVGFQPDYVWVKRSSARSEPLESQPLHRPSSLPGDATLRFHPAPIGSDLIKALQPDGFQVGSEPTVNSDGETYYYVAWKATNGP